MAEPVRVLLLEMPQLLRGILEHAIHEHGGCELVQGARGVFQLLPDRAVLPDVVIVGLSASEDATLVPALFARWPLAQVVTVMPAGEEAVMYQLKPCRRVLGQMPPAQIVDALREAVQQRRDRSRE